MRSSSVNPFCRGSRRVNSSCKSFVSSNSIAIAGSSTIALPYSGPPPQDSLVGHPGLSGMTDLGIPGTRALFNQGNGNDQHRSDKSKILRGLLGGSALKKALLVMGVEETVSSLIEVKIYAFKSLFDYLTFESVLIELLLPFTLPIIMSISIGLTSKPVRLSVLSIQ